MGKLTKAQVELLKDAASSDGAWSVEAYKPRQRLIELGLLELKPTKYGDRLHITDAGRRALDDQGGE